MDVFNQKPFPLKHALTQRVSKPLCNRQSSGEFIWWRAPLDLFVAPKRLTTRKLPLFCSDKWFWREEGRRKSVCVWDLAKDFGVSRSLTILRNNPLQAHTSSPHIYIRLLNTNMQKNKTLSHSQCFSHIQTLGGSCCSEAEMVTSVQTPEEKQFPSCCRACRVFALRRIAAI